MATIRIGTFNCENLFLRYGFAGPYVKRKTGESDKVYKARAAKARQAALVTFEKEGASLEWLARDLQDFSAITHTQRAATAAVIAENDPDIMALVEVESMEALRKFNSSAFFKKKRFPHCMLIDGNDQRGIDVALLSKHPITHIRSYIADTYKTPKGATVETFSRDCLVCRVEVNKAPITLFINHLKSQFQDNPVRRTLQAKRVAEIVEETFPQNTSSASFAVVGDLNQVPSDASLGPLLGKQWHDNVIDRLPVQDRWTHVYVKNNVVKSVNQLDYILLSKSLASKMKGKPVVERRGLARYKGLDKFYPDTTPRIKNVDKPGSEASDHCAVFVDVEM